MRGGKPGYEVMVVGKLLFETAKFSVKRAKESYDLLYAVGSGTAIGIASGETVRGSYELWRGSTRSNAKSRAERWYNRSLRRRFKGDVLVEGPDNIQETYSTGEPGYGRTIGSTKYKSGTGYRRRKITPSTRSRGCNCKSLLRRIMAIERQRKHRR